MVETQFSINVQGIKTDDGEEFVNRELRSLTSTFGIVLSFPHTSEKMRQLNPNTNI